jgi:hypothetical protein
MPRKIFQIVVYIFAVIGLFFTLGYFAVKYGLTNVPGIIDNQQQSFLDSGKSEMAADVVGSQTDSQDATNDEYYWQTLPEWQIIKIAVQKDQGTIDRAASTAGVPARLIVAQLMVEQLRFFTDDRESFKKFFEPLKILGSETQFSWGVMGMKEATAISVEQNLQNPTSPFYLGSQYAHLLDFQTADPKQERFARMTDQHDHYFSYLYAALFLREVETQWNSSGFDISNRPDIISTLYNIGFANSKPNGSPQSGGAAITLGPETESFGSLAAEFYNSNELLNEFPK